MKTLNLFEPFIQSLDSEKKLKNALRTRPELMELGKMAVSWGEDLDNVARWYQSPEYRQHRAVADNFIAMVPEVLAHVEKLFGQELVGEVRLAPSLMQFDGFARYDSGHHIVWFGVDHPDADENYLKALLAHELSHVFRDHQPAVWKKFKKPLKQVSRKEYLDQMDHLEHLASEGLATLFSQIAYPDVPLHVHHYYFEQEMRWCLENLGPIDAALVKCLGTDQEVWRFYEDDAVSPGSPSRIQYFWAARKIAEWLSARGSDFEKAVIEAHGWPSESFDCFRI